MPALIAHLPALSAIIGSVMDVRVENSDLVVMMEVAAFIMTMNFFASADTSAANCSTTLAM